jgi:hypothetical protein
VDKSEQRSKRCSYPRHCVGYRVRYKRYLKEMERGRCALRVLDAGLEGASEEKYLSQPAGKYTIYHSLEPRYAQSVHPPSVNSLSLACVTIPPLFLLRTLPFVLSHSGNDEIKHDVVEAPAPSRQSSCTPSPSSATRSLVLCRPLEAADPNRPLCPSWCSLLRLFGN